VATLKWLVVPASLQPMIAISITIAAAVPNRWASRARPLGIKVKNHASVTV